MSWFKKLLLLHALHTAKLCSGGMAVMEPYSWPAGALWHQNDACHIAIFA